jgi:hypothetical protein
MEIDLIAESTDGRAILLGEVEWSTKTSPGRVRQELESKSARFPLARGREILLAAWLPKRPGRLSGVAVFTPGQVLRALR